MTGFLTTPVGVASAYKAGQSSPGLSGGAAAPDGGFAAALQRAAEGAVDAGHAADNASAQAIAGTGSVTDVVLAVSKAELALQTAVAVRDRVVAAYQDVMRLPI